MMEVWKDTPVSGVVEYLGPGGHGGSQPLLMRSTTGDVVHVKLQMNPQTNRSLSSDWIGTVLGNALDAPVPFVEPVRIERKQLAQFPVLARMRWRPGIQFATVYWQGARPARPSDLSHVTNLDDLPLAALLETWLFDMDLKPSHVLLVHDGAEAKIAVADHGFIFPHGPKWSPQDLRLYRRDFPTVKPLTALAQASPRRFVFAPAVARIAALSHDQFHDIVDSVPQEWGLSAARRAAIVEFLEYRQGRLPRIAAYLESLWNHNKEPERPLRDEKAEDAAPAPPYPVAGEGQDTDVEMRAPDTEDGTGRAENTEEGHASDHASDPSGE